MNAGSGGSSRTAGVHGRNPFRGVSAGRHTGSREWSEAAPGTNEMEHEVEPRGEAHAGEACAAANGDSNDDDLVVVNESIKKRSPRADIHLANVIISKRRPRP